MITYTSLQAAVAAISTSVKSVLVSGSETLSADLTIPSTLEVTLAKGAIITLGNYDLTINGPFNGSLSQHFSCSGTGVVTFGTGAVKEIYPEWWGDNTTPGTTDMAPAIQAAITASRSSGVVSLLGETYALFTGVVIANPGTHIKGKSREHTELLYNGTDDAAVCYHSSVTNSSISRCGISDLKISAGTGTSKIGLDIHGGFILDVSRVGVIGFTGGIGIREKNHGSSSSIQVNYYDVQIYRCLTGIQFTSENSGVQYGSESSIYGGSIGWDDSVAAFTGIDLVYGNTIRMYGPTIFCEGAAYIAGSVGVKVGGDITLVNINLPVIENMEYGIQIAAGASRISVIEPSYTGNNTNFSDSGTNTIYMYNGTIACPVIEPSNSITFKTGIDDAEINNCYIVNGRTSDGILHVRAGGTAMLALNYNTGREAKYYGGGTTELINLEPDGDIKLTVAGKGLIMINAANTVTKRVRLNDAGDGLLFGDE